MRKPLDLRCWGRHSYLLFCLNCNSFCKIVTFQQGGFLLSFSIGRVTSGLVCSPCQFASFWVFKWPSFLWDCLSRVWEHLNCDMVLTFLSPSFYSFSLPLCFLPDQTHSVLQTISFLLPVLQNSLNRILKWYPPAFAVGLQNRKCCDCHSPSLWWLWGKEGRNSWVRGWGHVVCDYL